ncbi:SDR family NAD(P)-dependent oxidoreductase, partial [Mycolicibacterium fortuitum]|uniref:SDR family NAD(P)-dependent oxidoreductase n=1 Tax=Mycolicibacterium fortuitum TaxID=1766 RepID=UPI0034CE4EDB
MSVWFITGASRGFGLQIARDALERGHQVVATARDAAAVTAALGAGDNVLAGALDATNEEQAQKAAHAAGKLGGRIGVRIRNRVRRVAGAGGEANGRRGRSRHENNGHRAWAPP